MLVNDAFRKNELSLEPGGVIVTVVMENGKKYSYDKVKNVDAYSAKMKKDNRVIEIWVGSELKWKRNQ
jgi:hypothetical protein